MTQTQWLIIIIIGVLLSLVVRAVIELVRSRREKPACLAAAGSMGLHYAVDVAIDSLPRKDEFRLFAGKDAEHIPFMMSGSSDGVEVRIFDYVCSTYSGTQGRQRPSRRQTLVMFQTPHYRWPDLMMMPDSFALKLTKLLGVKDIDIPDAPGFSKRYLLNGIDEEALRGLFRREVTDAFSRRSGWCVEAHGDVIVFRLHDRRIPPQDIPSFFKQTIRLLQLLTRQT
jgi:hypothetical protein